MNERWNDPTFVNLDERREADFDLAGQESFSDHHDQGGPVTDHADARFTFADSPTNHEDKFTDDGSFSDNNSFTDAASGTSWFNDVTNNDTHSSFADNGNFQDTPTFQDS